MAGSERYFEIAQEKAKAADKRLSEAAKLESDASPLSSGSLAAALDTERAADDYLDLAAEQETKGNRGYF